MVPLGRNIARKKFSKRRKLILDNQDLKLTKIKNKAESINNKN
jgi:hypothetical protein